MNHVIYLLLKRNIPEEFCLTVIFLLKEVKENSGVMIERKEKKRTDDRERKKLKRL